MSSVPKVCFHDYVSRINNSGGPAQKVDRGRELIFLVSLSSLERIAQIFSCVFIFQSSLKCANVFKFWSMIHV